MIVFALTRVPGMLPQNFSAAYALVFCAGVYFAGSMAWWAPLVTMLITDLGLNLYYQFVLGIDSFSAPVLKYMAGNYLVYLLLIGFGKLFSRRASFVSLLGGGILGALLFYLVTNTLSWLLNPFGNPEYTKDLAGWIIALTKGTSGWPTALEFFRNTLLSGGLFTGLFVGAMKLNEAAEEKAEEAEEAEPEPEEPQPEEAKA